MSITRHWTTYLFYAYLATLVWLPLPLGSRPYWAVAFFNMLVAAMSLAALAGIWKTGHVLPPAFRMARWPIALWVVYCLWLVVQNIEGFSINAFRSYQQILLTLSYLQLFLLTLLLVDSRDRLKMLFYTLVISGVFQAVYGGVMTLSGVEKVWWIEKEQHRGLATGTFLNRNQLANYLVMCLSTGCGLLVATQKAGRINTWRQLLRRFVEWLLSSSGWLRLLMAVIVTGIVLTHSRMGNTSLFVSLTLIGVIWLWRNRSSWLRSFILIGSLLLIDALILGTWFGLDNVVERLQQTQTRNTAEWIANELEQRKAAQVELTLAKEQDVLVAEDVSTPDATTEDVSAPTIQAAPAVRETPAPVTPSATKPTAPTWKKGDPVNEQRDEALPQLIKMAKDYAITGIGLGNFSTGFTRYNRLNIATFYNEAHCDYLQFIIETGVVGAVLLGLLVLYCAGCGFITLCFCHSRMLQGVGFAVSMTTVASLMHAWVDYNFQATATAALFVVIMAIGVVSRALPDTVHECSRKRQSSERVERV